MTLLSELNHLELWGTDIGNAYLKAHTKEKLFIVAGPESPGRTPSCHGQSTVWNKNSRSMLA